ncbi:hypothetical protein B0H14DRAFT_2658502 [Mycena olivaceomarginata]|nr:hypothetical protein B0H14DRAFT_2658502 [Mycena olivaceomarginata]
MSLPPFHYVSIFRAAAPTSMPCPSHGTLSICFCPPPLLLFLSHIVAGHASCLPLSPAAANGHQREDFTTSTNQSIPDLAITSYPGLNAANRFTDFLTNFLPPHSARRLFVLKNIPVGQAHIGGTRILEATWQTTSIPIFNVFSSLPTSPDAPLSRHAEVQRLLATLFKFQTTTTVLKISVNYVHCDDLSHVSVFRSFLLRKEKKLQPSSSLQPSSEIFSHLEPTERNDTVSLAGAKGDPSRQLKPDQRRGEGEVEATQESHSSACAEQRIVPPGPCRGGIS